MLEQKAIKTYDVLICELERKTFLRLVYSKLFLMQDVKSTKILDESIPLLIAQIEA